MNKKYIVRKKSEIQNIINTGKKNVNNLFVIYKIKNILGYNRFCITINKKISSAVLRNKLKRIIKDILMKNTIKSSYDYVIIIRSNFLNLSYNEIKSNLLNHIRENNL